MNTAYLPTVHGCGQPAQWQVFACTPPAEGSRYGSPIGVVYSCAGHAAYTANVFANAGLIVATVDLARYPITRGAACGNMSDLRSDGVDELPTLLAKLKGPAAVS